MSRAENPSPEPTERDAWLTEALRHAPDADALPPPHLSETILRQARAASATPAARTPQPGGLRAWWAWLARPSVATSFAGLMVATLAGVMWWGQPLDETMRRPLRHDAPAPAVAAVPAVAPVATPATAPAVVDVARPADMADRAAVATASGEQRVAKAPAPPRATPMTPAAKRSAPRAEPAPATTDVVAASPAAESTPLASRRREIDTGVAKAAAGESADSRLALQGSTASAARASAASPAPVSIAASIAAITPLNPLRTAIAREPQRWQWQRDGGDVRPMTPEVQRWLALLDRASNSRWRTGTAPPADAAVLRLLLDGAPQATLRIGTEVVTFEATGPQAATSEAALPAAAIDSLKKALAELTP